ncbi:DUF1015 domain-containing protein [Patescibacteria group bacterium]|nr:DUF1015 domain-containing protein [Patescibacteria group bacterium]
MKSEKIGAQVADILIPRSDLNFYKWAVVACDQYTSQPEYWKEVDGLVGEDYSTLRLVLPEVYLQEKKEKKEKRIESINQAMEAYLKKGVLVEKKSAMIYLDRQTSQNDSRQGLVLAVDLEKYDYTRGSQTLIRATEGTILDRIPPRLQVREKASIELPHIMLLIDDPEETVIESLSQKIDELEKIYDTDLMMKGGHLTGYLIQREGVIDQIIKGFEKLIDPDVFLKKYEVDPRKYKPLLFATGDGNHSLATAKAHWDNVKKNLNKKEKESHPARLALVEVVNVHDQGLEFEPIHRVLFHVQPNEMIKDMQLYFTKQGLENKIILTDSLVETKERLRELNQENRHLLAFQFQDQHGILVINEPVFNLSVATLQDYLDRFLKQNSESEIDYVHGEEIVNNLSSKKGNIGFYLPAMDKNDLFKTVILDGSLPRKTFSMGEAEEKRFYFEARKIIK